MVSEVDHLNQAATNENQDNDIENTLCTSCIKQRVYHELYHFALGVVAGIAGAVIVYPIDSVKTRVQNQRSNLDGRVVDPKYFYNGYRDCLTKVVKYNGFLSLYSGMGAVLIGVGPEKAIKLTVNDFCRDKFADKDNNIPISLQALAGGLAGASQTVVTNPLEIVKIRMQLNPGSKLIQTVSEIGLFGLYKGLPPCLLRDITFSSLYFTAYATLKKKFTDDTNNLSLPYTLLAGFLAGFPAAFLSTPGDVIKTRLQAKPVKGVAMYTGTINAAVNIIAHEGFKGLFKGAGARCVRSPPQFAVTLFVYESLQRLGVEKKINYCFQAGVQTSSYKSRRPSIGLEVHNKFRHYEDENRLGLQLPKFEISPSVLL